MTERDLIQTRRIAPLMVSGDAMDDSKSAIKISPDKTRFVFQIRESRVADNTIRNSWFVTSVEPGGKLVNIGDAGDVHLDRDDFGFTGGMPLATSDAKWSADNLWISYLARHGDEVQLWRSRADGSAQEKLTDNPANVRDFFWSLDGRSIYYTVEAQTRHEVKTARQSEEARGYLIDDRFNWNVRLSPMDAPQKQVALWVYDLRSRKEREATRDDQAAFDSLTEENKIIASGAIAIQPPRVDVKAFKIKFGGGVAAPVVFDGDGARIAFAAILEPRDRRFHPSARVSALFSDVSAKPVTCASDYCKGIIDKVWWSIDGREIVFARLEGIEESRTAFYAWAAATGKVRHIASTEDWLLGCETAKRRLLCWAQAPGRPDRIMSLDLERGRLATVVDPNPALQSIRWAAQERIEVANEFNERTFGYLIKPPRYNPGKKYPLFVLTYRARGFFDETTGWEYPVQVLAANGIMVYVFDRPMYFASEVSDEERFGNNNQDRRHVQSSLEAGIRELERRGIVDSDRIAIGGLSDGTAISFWALVHSERKYRTAVVSSGTWEPISYYLVPSWYRRDDPYGYGQRGRAFSQDGPILSFFADIAPSLNASRIDAPVLLNLPQSEVLGMTPLFYTLQEYGKPFEAYVFEDEWHTKWQPRHLYNICRRNVQWLQFWLQGTEANDPVDSDQFARWRGLRGMQQAGAAKRQATSR
jgi:dipeptidyl aminopeptidase/acylaminoacyl peptidase